MTHEILNAIFIVIVSWSLAFAWRRIRQLQRQAAIQGQIIEAFVTEDVAEMHAWRHAFQVAKHDLEMEQRGR